MIDDGELDWKVIAIDVNDPKAAEVNDVDDVEKVFPVSALPPSHPILVRNPFAYNSACAPNGRRVDEGKPIGRACLTVFLGPLRLSA